LWFGCCVRLTCPRLHRRSSRSRCRPEPAAAVVHMQAPAFRQRMPPAPLSPPRPALGFREIAFSFEPPVPGFECRFLYQVLRALAVIFRQRWEGFQILAKNPQAGSQPARCKEGAGQALSTDCGPPLWADSRPIISPGMSGIHQSNRQLRPYPWPGSPLAAAADRAFARPRNPARLYSRSGGVRQRTFKPQFRMRRLCGALATSREAGDYGTNNRC